MMTIYFDMDGTIADLYSVDNWLESLHAYDTEPYTCAAPMQDLRQLARLLNRLQNNGYRIGIISWLSKESTYEYDNAVRAAKKRWLAQHLPSVVWDEIHLVKYGTPKHFCCQDKAGILFDDNEHIRGLWNKYGTAYGIDNIIEILKSFLE
jgi:hypothetical protein